MDQTGWFREARATGSNHEAATGERFFIEQATVDTGLIRNILKSAAYLVAAMRDPAQGVKAEGLSLEVRDSLDILQQEMDAAHLLDSYKSDSGEIRI